MKTCENCKHWVQMKEYEGKCVLYGLKHCAWTPSEATCDEWESDESEDEAKDGDLISRADAIALLTKIVFDEPPYLDSETLCRLYAEEQINTLPSAEAVSREEHIKELNDLAVAWKAKFAKAEKITDEIYDETMAKVAKECEEYKERLRNIRPSAEAVQGWIPCSERLPSDGDTVIVSVVDDHGDTPWKYTTVAWLCNGVWISDNDILCGTAVAWMPLPKPYREESIE